MPESKWHAALWPEIHNLYLQDLTAEALQFEVTLAAADNDDAARDALLLTL